MLLAIEFPDAAGDAAVGKRTLVVRLGALPAARLYAAMTLAAFGALPLWALAGLPARVAVAPLLLAPIAIWQAVRVARGAYGDRARWGSVAFWAVALLIASAGAELVAVATLVVDDRARRRLKPGAARDGDQPAHDGRQRAHEVQASRAPAAAGGRSATSARVSQSCARRRRRRSRSKRASAPSPSAR